tara:strand:+ start:742 stop:1143 length:402 start_codon:yes stop_codon:yes gene_type:complete
MRNYHSHNLYQLREDWSQYDEEPFFRQVVQALNATKTRYKFQGQYDIYKCTCPICGNPAAALTTFSSRGHTSKTYGLSCPDTSGHKGLTLLELIRDHCSQELYDEWSKARYIKHDHYQWYGIKCRKTKKTCND